MDSPSTPTPGKPAVAAADKEMLRRLAEELAAIVALPVHKEKALLWTNLNDRRSTRPMVWIDEMPWHELDFNGELTLRCRGAWARGQEEKLRRTIYQWRHFPADMVPVGSHPLLGGGGNHVGPRFREPCGNHAGTIFTPDLRIADRLIFLRS